MRFPRFLVVVVLLLCSELVVAQNGRLSQIWTAPMLVNPSLSGRFDGKFRVGALYSWQKSNVIKIPHQNYYFDYKFGKYRHVGDEEQFAIEKGDSAKKKTEYDAKDETGLRQINKGFWSAGFNFYRYGDNNTPVIANFYSVNVARHFYVKRNKYFGFGVQGTYADGDLDEYRNRIRLKDKKDYTEISGSGFRYPPPYNFSDTLKGSKSYVDFNVGGYYGMSTEPVSFELGFAMYHLFYPKNNIYEPGDSESKLRHRVTAHSLLRLKLNDNWGFVQRNIYWEEGLYYRSKTLKDSIHLVSLWAGIEFYKTQPKSNYNFNFGLYMRDFRTIMPFVNLNLHQYINLRYSYEFPVNREIYPALNAKRSEVVLIFTYKRNTPPGVRFSKKVNYW